MESAKKKMQIKWVSRVPAVPAGFQGFPGFQDSRVFYIFCLDFFV
jgi:hypothetical protein